jgi:hypothetical protein
MYIFLPEDGNFTVHPPYVFLFTEVAGSGEITKMFGVVRLLFRRGWLTRVLLSLRYRIVSPHAPLSL